MKNFPQNVFPDVERNAFKKFSKKNVTEDYIKENLKLQGWDCYAPFTDTGLDLIATKEVDGRLIYRFIQIKTRSLDSKGKFGFTLKSKDFETDCRKFFFFYCDSDSNDNLIDDVLIISMYDYMNLCYENKEIGLSHFGTASFKNGNNKINSIKCEVNKKEDEENNWTWVFQRKKLSLNKYLNNNGLKLFNSTDYDDNLETKNAVIGRIKKELFYAFEKGNKNAKTNCLFEDGDDTGTNISTYMKKRSNILPEKYIKDIGLIAKAFKSKYPELYESHLRYLIKDALDGGDSDE